MVSLASRLVPSFPDSAPELPSTMPLLPPLFPESVLHGDSDSFIDSKEISNSTSIDGSSGRRCQYFHVIVNVMSCYLILF